MPHQQNFDHIDLDQTFAPRGIEIECARLKKLAKACGAAVMPASNAEPDIEEGVLTSEIFAEWNFDESRLAWASNYIAGNALHSKDFELKFAL